MKRKSNRAGMTLAELLIVCGLITFLATALVPPLLALGSTIVREGKAALQKVQRIAGQVDG